MERDKFEELVVKALSELPAELESKLENIDVVIADRPSTEQMARMGLRHYTDLLGLYEGVPLTKRGTQYGMVPPDKITIFQKPIEAKCQNERGIAAEVRQVLRHEIAHYFGFDEASLERIEDET